MRIKRLSALLAIVLALGMFTTAHAAEAEKTITENELGTHDGFDYELWKDSGTTSMVLKDGGAFSCTWSDINNALFRKGMKFDKTKTYEELGNISVTYECDYQPKGNSYLCVYGWTVDPLVEYYIIESWGNWRPPGAISKGTITVDDGTYDVYETTRTEQPSIVGTATFQQYWSVRTEKRVSGTISVAEHFKAWESLGMKMGKMYEASFLVEGYQSTGTADIISNTIAIGEGVASQSAVVVPAGSVKAVIREGTAAFGTPAMDGKKDEVWDNTEALPIDQMLQTQDTASGTARVLWDDNNLYVLVEATDDNLDNTAEAVHEKDSAEVFVDEKNCKLGGYAADDGQYRVCYDGGQSFGDSTKSEGFESVVTVDGINYTIEMKIPFKTLKPEDGMKIGFDAQVNDGEGGSRAGIAKWSDTSDNSWQDTSAWGVVTLKASDNAAASSEAVSSETTSSAASEAAPATDSSTEKGGVNPLVWAVLAAVAVIAGVAAIVFTARKRK